MRIINNDNNFWDGIIPCLPKRPYYEGPTYNYNNKVSDIIDTTLLGESYKEKDKLSFGDVVLVKGFWDEKTNLYVDNDDHPLIIIGNSCENNMNKREYFAYSLSTNVQLSNKYNEKFPKRLYIDNCANTIKNSPMKPSPVYIDTEGFSIFKLANLKGNNWYVGHITSDFEQFLKRASQAIIKKEDTSKLFYVK